jgi:CheY-like chemotaxis protein
MRVIPDSPLALVVDDEPDVGDLIGDMLASFGVLAVAMNEPSAVLEQAIEHRPALIVLDVLMPGMDGYTVAARLRKHPRTRTIPIVFITGLADPRCRTLSKNAGGVAHLQKPFTVEALRDAVGRTLAP